MMPEGFVFKDWCRICRGYTPHVIVTLYNRKDQAGVCKVH